MKTRKQWAGIRPSIFFDPITHSKRFVDNHGEHPKIMDTIDGVNIVLNKEELNENNWLFLVDNEEERKEAKMQIDEITRYEDYTIIFE